MMKIVKHKTLISAVVVLLFISCLSYVKASTTTPAKSSASENRKIVWKDDFNSLNTSFWNVPDRTALEGSIRQDHLGYFKKNNVWVKNGYLILRLTQRHGKVDANENGIISSGAELESKKKFGYGTYEWRMRLSSTSEDPTKPGKTVPGQISAGFNFVNNSQTEIDFEVEGQYPNQLEMTTWKNPDTSGFPTTDDRIFTFKQIPNLSSQFHTFTFIWKPDVITYFLDGKLVATHKEHVPTTSANFMINHWGTDNEDFGGLATPGATRYMIVDWVKYTSLL